MADERHVRVEPEGHRSAREHLLESARSLFLKGVSQMVYILPERLLALVRPAFDLVLRTKSKTVRGDVRLQNRDP